MYIGNFPKLETMDNDLLSNEQKIIGDHWMKKGYEAFLEHYSDYTYLVLVGNSVKRLNRTGHDVYINPSRIF